MAPAMGLQGRIAPAGVCSSSSGSGVRPVICRPSVDGRHLSVPAANGALHQGRAHRLVAHQKGNLADDLLDYVTAGPKMRKWYGQGERPTDGGPPPDQEPQQQEEEEEEEGDGDAVLVTDADTPIGELVTLQLILARASVKILVKDATAARTSYGPYVEPLSLDPGSDTKVLRRALRGCGSVVLLGRPGVVPQLAQQAGLAHLVLLSATGKEGGNPFASLFDNELSALKDPAREAAVTKSGVRHTIIRVSGVRGTPGGTSNLTLVPGGSSSGSRSEGVSREDLATVVVEALKRPPQAGGRTFEVCSLGAGTPPADWNRVFEGLGAPVPAS